MHFVTLWLIFENSQIVQLSELVYQQIIHPGMDLLGVHPPSPGQRGAGGVLFFMIKQKIIRDKMRYSKFSSYI
jgi:hypothetical protein